MFNFHLNWELSLISFRFLLNSRFYVSEKSPHFDLQFLHEIKVKFDDFLFRWIFLKFSFIIYHFPQFLQSIHCPIWSNSKRSSEISLIPCGFNPYLPLYPSIRDIFIKLVSLELFLTLDRVQLMTTRSGFVKSQKTIKRERIWVYIGEAYRNFEDSMVGIIHHSIKGRDASTLDFPLWTCLYYKNKFRWWCKDMFTFLP